MFGSWRIEARIFVEVDEDARALAGLRNDSFVTLRLAYYL
jgi:hypothetical protein